MPMLIDTHCHIDRVDLAPFGHDLDQMLSATRALDVGKMVCVSVDLESFPAIHALSKQYPDIYCSVGVHPGEENVREATVDELVTLGASDRVVAVGETGLDYYRLPEASVEEYKAAQRARFQVHIQAAKVLGKPLIIHTRSAQSDTLALLRDAQTGDGIFHCFTEDWAMAKAGLDLGYYLSFSGIVTFKNATDLQDVAKKVPLDRLLVETDAPYLTPVPHRGKPNYPGNVHYVATFLADLRGESYAEFAEATTRNAERVFRFK